jgi:Tol biopolymer transport system component
VVLSPDGRRAALGADDEESDVWIFDVERGALTRLTFGPSLDGGPIWTADGRHVIYASTRDGTVYNLYSQLADGTGSPKRLTVSNQQVPVADATRWRA